MQLLYDLLLIFIIVVIVFVLGYTYRKKLLKMWKDVSIKEIIFHRLMNRTIVLFYAQKDTLRNEDNRLQFIRLGRSRKKKMRFLLLQERQEIFLALSDLYDEIEELNTTELDELKKQFKELQKARRTYNSIVLIYNQSISIFPTRFLALRMNMKIKEYFG